MEKGNLYIKCYISQFCKDRHRPRRNIETSWILTVTRYKIDVTVNKVWRGIICYRFPLFAARDRRFCSTLGQRISANSLSNWWIAGTRERLQYLSRSSYIIRFTNNQIFPLIYTATVVWIQIVPSIFAAGTQPYLRRH